MLPDLKLYYKAIVTKIVWDKKYVIGIKSDIQINITKKNPEIKIHTCIIN